MRTYLQRMIFGTSPEARKRVQGQLARQRSVAEIEKQVAEVKADLMGRKLARMRMAARWRGTAYEDVYGKSRR